ncbi:MAG: DUF1254 domain-containing protein [Saprospiraceae bacterium]|nr:DUF1254 domain-containing protein [Saprospiraceae bacterium]
MQQTTKTTCHLLLLTATFIIACQSPKTPDKTLEEARSIAKEAYIYGFPLVDCYRIQYAYTVDTASPEYKAPWNHINNNNRVFTPEDKVVQTPNSDTPYSMLGMDLRTEPIVLTVPPIEEGRYFSIQLIDAYTHNFAYIGSRTTGNGGGSFMVAGPNWKGTVPPNIKTVFYCETELASAIYRTQLFRPADIENVEKIQEGYKVQTLSAFAGEPAPPPAPAINFVKPLSVEAQKSSLEFFNVLNFVLQFCPTHPTETELMARFAKIGVGKGQNVDAAKLSPEMKKAIEQGMADAWEEMAKLKKRVDAGEVTASDGFGNRAFLKNNYLYRMSAAVMGIFGNSKEEAMYPMYTVDNTGAPLNGANSYTVRFAPGQLPPAHAFWSLTMYELPSSLLVANPLNRYLLNAPMMDQFVKDADGGITFYIQNVSPGKGKEANWLPAPSGPFFMALRLYWPKDEALNGTWTAPAIQKVQK